MSVKNILNPSSIAIVGATDRPGSFGHNCAHFALLSSCKDSVYLVNPTKTELFGKKVYPTLADLPSVPECVAICLPYAKINDVLIQCGELGIHGAVVFASGYSEIPDPAGRKREEELADICAKYDISVLGPNCGGFINHVNNIMLWGLWLNTDKLERPTNGLSIISQSGGVVANFFNSAFTDISYALSIGNGSVVTPEEYLDYLLDDETTKIVALYMEGCKRPQALCKALEKASQLNKPVVILKGGRCEKGVRSAMAHTGSVAGNFDVFSAVARRYGAIVVNSEDELITTCTALASLEGKYASGCSAANVNLSGAQTTQCADACTKVGINIPDFDAVTCKLLSKRLPDFATVKNPLDATTELFKDLRRCSELMRFCGSAEGVDFLIFTAANLSSVEGFDANAMKAMEYARADGFEAPIFIVPNYELSRDYIKWKTFRSLRAAVVSPGMTGYSEIKYIGDFFAYRKDDHSMETAAFDVNQPSAVDTINADAGLFFEKTGLCWGKKKDGDIELHIEINRDSQFGPVLSLRAGGVFGLTSRNICLSLCPMTMREAKELLNGLDFCGQLDRGADAIAEILVNMSMQAAKDKSVLAKLVAECAYSRQNGLRVTDGKFRTVKDASKNWEDLYQNGPDTPLPEVAVHISNGDLRNGQQCKYATRFTTDEIVPLAAKMDRLGYSSMEVWGGATFDVCVRYLNNDPWERLRRVKSVMKNTPTRMLVRGQNLLGYHQYPDDVCEKFVELAAKNGMDIFAVFDGINDVRNTEVVIRAAQKAGKRVTASIPFSNSPVHTIDFMVKIALEYKALGIDSIAIADTAGQISPRFTYEIDRALREQTGMTVSTGGFDVAGMSKMQMWEGIRAGCMDVTGGFSCMAGGTAPPSQESILAALRGTSADPKFDFDLLAEINSDMQKVCDNHKDTETQFKGVNIDVLKHQLPGGMISNMENQLRMMNSYDRIGEVFDEVAVVRRDMGYPPLVTPFSQMVGAQATTNVLTGKRYGMISKEVRDYVAGKYGRVPAPIDAELKRLVLGDKAPSTARPGSLLEPGWEKACAASREFTRCEEDVMIYALFPEVGETYLRNKYGLIHND